MIYVDTSVVLAHLLAEDRSAANELWNDTLVSSRLLVYEAWNRLNRQGLGASHGAALLQLLERVAFLELRNDVLARATEPFPVGVRTLDALHLASLSFFTERRIRVSLASYDEKLLAAARALDLAIVTF